MSNTITTPIKVHFENPRSPQNADYPETDGYKEAVSEAEGEAKDDFTNAKEQFTRELTTGLSSANVVVNEAESYPGWPVSSLDFITVVVDVTHTLSEEKVIGAAQQAANATSFGVEGVYRVEPEQP